MSEFRNSQADSATAGETSARYHLVRTPERTDGIGMALRRAFGPCARAIQDEFNGLLGKIDQATKIDRG